MDKDAEIKWLMYLADRSKLEIDEETREVYYDGELVEGIWFPVISTQVREDIKEMRVLGLDMDAELRWGFMESLKERVEMTPMEVKMARIKMCTYKIRDENEYV